MRWMLLFVLLFVGQAHAAGVQAIDCSGTITSGTVAQTQLIASSQRAGFQIQNLDTSEPLWISFTTTAAANTAGSYALAAATSTTLQNGGSYYSPLGFSNALSIVAATTGHKFSCTYWRNIN